MYRYSQPSTLTRQHYLNFKNSLALKKISVLKVDVAACFRIISEQRRNYGDITILSGILEPFRGHRTFASIGPAIPAVDRTSRAHPT